LNILSGLWLWCHYWSIANKLLKLPTTSDKNVFGTYKKISYWIFLVVYDYDNIITESLQTNSWNRPPRRTKMCLVLTRNSHINPLKPELNPICYLLALLGAHHFLHVSRIRVKLLTFRRLMSYIYIYIYIWSTHSWCF